MFKELAEEIGAADAPLLVAGVPISNREEYLVNPRLAVCRAAPRRSAPPCTMRACGGGGWDGGQNSERGLRRAGGRAVGRAPTGSP